MIERTEVLGADPGQRIIVHEYREILFGILLQDGMSRRDASALLRAEQGAAPGLFEQQAQILSDYRDSQIGEDPTMQDVFQHYIETDPRTVIADSIAWAAARDIAAQAAGQAFTQGPEGL
jgi:hypothetical protein